MFDTQKLEFDKFITGLKHGVYIITSDTCQLCKDYERDISRINNHYLYFVECTTQDQRNLVQKLADRAAFPMTIGFYDNELKFTRLGHLFGDDWLEVETFLQQFGNAPLTEEQIEEKTKKIKNKCQLAYYIFPPGFLFKDKVMSQGYKYNELPIDVDSFGQQEPSEEIERMFDGNFHHAKLVVFDPRTTNEYSPIAKYLLKKSVEFAQMKGSRFEPRELSEYGF